MPHSFCATLYRSWSPQDWSPGEIWRPVCNNVLSYYSLSAEMLLTARWTWLIPDERTVKVRKLFFFLSILEEKNFHIIFFTTVSVKIQLVKIQFVYYWGQEKTIIVLICELVPITYQASGKNNLLPESHFTLFSSYLLLLVHDLRTEHHSGAHRNDATVFSSKCGNRVFVFLIFFFFFPTMWLQFILHLKSL